MSIIQIVKSVEPWSLQELSHWEEENKKRHVKGMGCQVVSLEAELDEDLPDIGESSKTRSIDRVLFVVL